MLQRVERNEAAHEDSNAQVPLSWLPEYEGQSHGAARLGLAVA
jgi:hypothetical protein